MEWTHGPGNTSRGGLMVQGLLHVVDKYLFLGMSLKVLLKTELMKEVAKIPHYWLMIY